ncbi:MAG: ABC transporter permease [Acidimicrobiia bacterium]|nr:ABC transporter permease [Acidimicrobiia bacterium]
MSDAEDFPEDEVRGDPDAAQPEPTTLDRIVGISSSLRQALVVPALAVLTALIVGAVIIAVTDLDTLPLWGTDPGEAFRLTMSGIGKAYKALLVGSVGSQRAISETLFAATPLILAGLAVAVGFQAGLFNIGVNGQMHIGGMAALWVGFSLTLPAFIHIPLAIAAAIMAGAIWAGIAGFLKARTGAHEVITTIMLNFVALFLVDYLLKTSVFQATGRNDPISEKVKVTAQFPTIPGFDRLNIGFFFSLLAVAFVWWLMYRSTIGFEFRAVGFNPSGGRYAGMNVAWVYLGVMAVSGALAGIAGANPILGLEPYRGTSGFAGTIGFDAIALALLGRSHPVGVLFAGILFGALRAGGREMQGAAGVPIDLVLVLQALIIVMIAAPRLVRAIYRIKTPDQDVSTTISTGWGG